MFRPRIPSLLLLDLPDTKAGIGTYVNSRHTDKVTVCWSDSSTTVVEEDCGPVTAVMVDELAMEDVMAAEWAEKDQERIVEQETSQTQLRAGCRWD